MNEDLSRAAPKVAKPVKANPKGCRAAPWWLSRDKRNEQNRAEATPPASPGCVIPAPAPTHTGANSASDVYSSSNPACGSASPQPTGRDSSSAKLIACW